MLDKQSPITRRTTSILRERSAEERHDHIEQVVSLSSHSYPWSEENIITLRKQVFPDLFFPLP
jgi:hypothetical protein